MNTPTTCIQVPTAAVTIKRTSWCTIMKVQHISTHSTINCSARRSSPPQDMKVYSISATYQGKPSAKQEMDTSVQSEGSTLKRRKCYYWTPRGSSTRLTGSTWVCSTTQSAPLIKTLTALEASWSPQESREMPLLNGKYWFLPQSGQKSSTSLTEVTFSRKRCNYLTKMKYWDPLFSPTCSSSTTGTQIKQRCTWPVAMISSACKSRSTSYPYFNISKKELTPSKTTMASTYLSRWSQALNSRCSL